MPTNLRTTLVLTILLLAFLSRPSLQVKASQLEAIDVFTQREPFSGRGANMRSDAFHPGEGVSLYASVQLNEAPLQQALVTFRIEGPPDAAQITFHRVGETNASGIATVDFTIPTVENESRIFGNWTVYGFVEICDSPCEDTLTFEVDWIVKIVSLKLINGTLTRQADFGIGGDVGVEIGFTSISMVEREATLSLTIQDERKVPVSSLILSNIWVQPNKTIAHIYCALGIPKWATIGMATMYASALTALPSLGGVPYFPGIETSFRITTETPRLIEFQDVAVTRVTRSLSRVTAGELVGLNLTVRNEGTTPESFEVNLYCNAMLVESFFVDALLPYTQTSWNVWWNTSGLALGDYTISASIPSLSNEVELADNDYIDGTVRIESAPVITHDLAVTRIVTSSIVVSAGSPVVVEVTVRNEGTEVESFNVTAYFGEGVIGTVWVGSLAAGHVRHQGVGVACSGGDGCGG
jgi:hypothetical protein